MSEDGELREADWLSLCGSSILIFGGAYLLRALTESHVLPQVGGVALGIAYALVLIVVAAKIRQPFYAGTAAAIAFPLVWETTVRFHYVTPAIGGICAALIGVILLIVAKRNDQEAIAWIGSIGSIACTIAIVRADSILPLMISASIVGATTLFMRWKFVALPAAVLTNSLAAMAVGLPLIRGDTIEHPGRLILALVVFAAVWLAFIFTKQYHGFFDIIESALVLAIGVGGAAIIAAVSHKFVIPLAALYAATGIAAWLRNRIWVALYLVALAAFLTLDARPAVIVVALCAFVTSFRSARTTLLTISILLLFVIAGENHGPLFRTCLLAAIATALALASQLTIAKILLGVAGLKLLAEDVRLETASTLVMSFMSYGLAIMTVARCVRRHTTHVHQSPSDPTNDTSCSATPAPDCVATGELQ